MSTRDAMSHRRALTDEQLATVRAELAVGRPYRSIAARFGCSVNTIARVARGDFDPPPTDEEIVASFDRRRQGYVRDLLHRIRQHETEPDYDDEEVELKVDTWSAALSAAEVARRLNEWGYTTPSGREWTRERLVSWRAYRSHKKSQQLNDLIDELRDRGITWEGVARELNRRGFTTERGATWKVSSLTSWVAARADGVAS